ncbi:ABC transporter permease [Streptomyces agglomeratus]|uniref:Xylose transport system permease protein XylH n=1 Tax=Streptomyces agglomeratus TaxID=285458 RepID=A0A1E5PBZ6_9ACTN|nr:ABC transporter permease [Streptomyces agglomeratus]OEJ27058.1 ABC transporter permease [Streptomyces agglomeratus]OEJ38893.1 ABC transporter permease [Streptomyces agglomeratus]OEJ46724.1 ABC transporter permease [Streptomyces agglomeratus]OEJ51421.1 ABC transporter permease [Streptomyces agglomeratus]OEJ58822.1 ABC transporter permease [Streptomyces agglomeratus]
MSRDRRGPDDASTQEPARDALPAVDTRLLVREEGVRGYLREFGRKLRSGELGSLPVVVAVIVIWTVFGSLNSTFLSAQNLSDLSQQIVGTGMIAVGIVFVLLLGEIDLSVGSVSGLCAALFAVLNVLNGVNEWLALLIAIAGGAAVGLVQGFFFAKVGVPAFVVTLAGNLAWNGLMLQILGSSGTVNIPSESVVSKLYSTIFHSPVAAYLAAAVGVGLLLAASLLDAGRRKAAGVPFRPLGEIVLRTVVIAAIAFTAAYILNLYQGLPLALLIFLILLVILDFVLRRTTYGRQVFAVGGNIEGARRAGISVPFVRMSVFSIAGTMAAVGGVFLAGQIQSASQTSGGGNLLMNVIAAAVIGGTSLFGGRGSVWSALLGALVIGSIQSGMNIMGLSNAIQFMITGAVLLAAVVVDSLSRRSQKAAGRA